MTVPPVTVTWIALGEVAFAVAWAAGRALSLEEAINAAITSQDRPDDRR